jgi:hypothetical protein
MFCLEKFLVIPIYVLVCRRVMTTVPRWDIQRYNLEVGEMMEFATFHWPETSIREYKGHSNLEDKSELGGII